MVYQSPALFLPIWDIKLETDNWKVLQSAAAMVHFSGTRNLTWQRLGIADDDFPWRWFGVRVASGGPRDAVGLVTKFTDQQNGHDQGIRHTTVVPDLPCVVPLDWLMGFPLMNGDYIPKTNLKVSNHALSSLSIIKHHYK